MFLERTEGKRTPQQGYNSFNCRIYHNGPLSEPFLTTTGVRKSCPPSHLIFLLVLDMILKRVMNDKLRGTAWKWMNSLEDLKYADDACLLSHKYDHMQSKLDELCSVMEG
jgi:hypothetical protein